MLEQFATVPDMGIEVGKYTDSNTYIVRNHIDENELRFKLHNLNMAHTFFEDMDKYTLYRGANYEVLEKMILDVDDLIDEFEVFSDTKKTGNKLQDEYNKKAVSFYNVLIDLQMNMGYYLSDRKHEDSKRNSIS